MQHLLVENAVCEMQIQFEGRQATGVVIKHEGEEKIVKATGEIILAAGTVGTTKLLLLSGVGPKAHLQELKVQHVNCKMLIIIQCAISK